MSNSAIVPDAVILLFHFSTEMLIFLNAFVKVLFSHQAGRNHLATTQNTIATTQNTLATTRNTIATTRTPTATTQLPLRRP